MVAVGIDLGTTSSAAAVSDGNSLRLIPDPLGRPILPSLVVIRKDRQFFVGHEAMVEARKYSGENLTIGSLKRMMDRQKEFHWGQVRSSPQVLTALILAELKVQVEMYLGEQVNQAVIAVPANFGFFQRQFTREAALIAGWEVRRIYNEATAAVCALSSRLKQQFVVAADLGGGTFDVSVIDCGDGVYEVRAVGGDDRLGGEDFTDILIKIILRKAASAFDVTFVQNDMLTMRRIKDVAEECKLLLSGSESVLVRVPYIKSRRGTLEDIVCSVSRAEFESECAPLVGRMERIVDQALREAGLPSNRANIWLLGNASRMPAISRHLRGKYSVKPPSLLDLKTSVALGAAKLGATLSGMEKNLLLLDVTPRSLGVPTRAGDFEPLILKNSTIPTRATKIFTTVSDNQTSISVPILEEAERGSHKILGTLTLDGIPPRKAGIQKIEIVFDVDANTMLHVSAKAEGFDAGHVGAWSFPVRKKRENWGNWEGKKVEVKCDGFELPEVTLNQYHLLVQDWIETRRKRWPKTGS